MKRYRLDVLEDRGGRLFFQGEPYTGIAYEVVGDLVVANHQFTNGARGGPEEVWSEDRKRVLLEAVLPVEPDDVGEQYPKEGDYFEGAPFEGVAYAFDADTGMLLEETDFCPDPVGLCRTWSDSGALTSYSGLRRQDGTSVSEMYFPDGRVHDFHSDRIGWSQTELGRLRTLSLRPEYSESDLRPAPMEVDPTLLRLAGKGVTDNILERLTHMEGIEKLHLEGTGISDKGLEKFRVCSKLQELLTYPGNDFSEADVRRLLTFLPNCRWSNRLV